jgi:hypothetical protein
MVTTAPKNSRNKRLHLVFFTDASKTKSTSISLRNLVIVGCTGLLFFAGASASLYLYKKSRETLTTKEEYIRELKSAITALAVTGEKGQLALSGEADPNGDLTLRVSREIEFPSESDFKNVSQAREKTLASLQSSLNSLSTVSANLARPDKNPPKAPSVNSSKSSVEDKSPQTPAEQISKTVSVGNTAVKSAASTADTIPAVKPSPKGPPLSGVQVEQSHTTEANGRTTLHFQLVNTVKNRSHSWTGRVCGIAEITQGNSGHADKAGQVGLSARSAVGGFVAIPGGIRLDSASSPNNGCAEGQLVRFSRLRPTELVIPAKQESIKRVTVFFVESGSNRMHAQPIEL